MEIFEVVEFFTQIFNNGQIFVMRQVVVFSSEEIVEFLIQINFSTEINFGKEQSKNYRVKKKV